jgi:predicted permease
MLGQATIPMMLVSLGYRLHDFHCVHRIDAEGVNRQVLLLYSALVPR